MIRKTNSSEELSVESQPIFSTSRVPSRKASLFIPSSLLGGSIDDLSMKECYHRHVQESSSDSDLSSPRHVLLSLDSFEKPPHLKSEDLQIYFAIYDAQSKSIVTDEFMTTFNDSISDCQFIGLYPKDESEELFVVCRIYRFGLLKGTEESTRRLSIRGSSPRRNSINLDASCTRPIGGCFIALGSNEIFNQKLSVLSPFNERNFGDIFNLMVSKSEKLQSIDGLSLTISIKLLHDVSKDVFTCNRQSIQKCLSSINEQRHILYVTVHGGDFLRGRKKSGKNVQLVFSICDENGQLLRNSVSRGRSYFEDEYISSVQYHQDHPLLNETIAIALPPPNDLHKYHLYIEMRHCSTSTKPGDTSLGAFAFSVQPLTVLNGSTHCILKDMERTLQCYTFKYKFKPPNALFKGKSFSHTFMSNSTDISESDPEDELQVPGKSRTRSSSTSKRMSFSKSSDEVSFFGPYIMVPSQETLVISTYLSSNLVSSNKHLQTIFNAQEDPQIILNALEAVSMLSSSIKEPFARILSSSLLKLIVEMNEKVALKSFQVLCSFLSDCRMTLDPLKTTNVIQPLVKNMVHMLNGGYNYQMAMKSFPFLLSVIRCSMIDEEDIDLASVIQLLDRANSFAIFIDILATFHLLFDADELFNMFLTHPCSKRPMPNQLEVLFDHDIMGIESFSVSILSFYFNQFVSALELGNLNAFVYLPPLVAHNVPFDDHLTLLFPLLRIFVDQSTPEFVQNVSIAFYDLVASLRTSIITHDTTEQLVQTLLLIFRRSELSKDRRWPLIRSKESSICFDLIRRLQPPFPTTQPFWSACFSLMTHISAEQAFIEFPSIFQKLWESVPESIKKNLDEVVIPFCLENLLLHGQSDEMERVLEKCLIDILKLNADSIHSDCLFLSSLEFLINEHSPPFVMKRIVSLELSSSLEHNVSKLLLIHNPTETAESRVESCSFLLDRVGNQSIEFKRSLLQKVVRLQREESNLPELGQALLLLSECYEWTPSSCLHKIKVLKECTEVFRRIHMWELCVKVLEELFHFYHDISCDYNSSLSVLRIIEGILSIRDKEPRMFYCYFEVSFRGADFPSELRGMDLIYRADPFTSTSDFAQSMQQQYPQAHVSNHSFSKSASILDQFIQVKAVSIAHKPSMEFGIDRNTLEFRHNWGIKFFKSSQIQRNPQKSDLITPSNEFSQIWVTQFSYETKHPLPFLTKRQEIIKIASETFSPLQNAVIAIQEKNANIRDIIDATLSETSQGNTADVSPLSMVLNGVIDAAVQGGVKKYQEAFFESNYLRIIPEDLGLVEPFCSGLTLQIELLGEGLHLFDKICTETLRPLYHHLSNCFSSMKLQLEVLSQHALS